ncbi:MAG: hypothetical protein VB016_02495 [Methanomassiliicoccaceae archaeon]|jgi:hypothetical protein|nr:hypothetical protein [Methanomassiliicoccaceae archaeon]
MNSIKSDSIENHKNIKRSRNLTKSSKEILMKVVDIGILDTDTISDFVLDYCLYHELRYQKIEFNPTANRHEKDFAALGKKYPQKNEAED